MVSAGPGCWLGTGVAAFLSHAGAARGGRLPDPRPAQQHQPCFLADIRVCADVTAASLCSASQRYICELAVAASPACRRQHCRAGLSACAQPRCTQPHRCSQPCCGAQPYIRRSGHAVPRHLAPLAAALAAAAAAARLLPDDHGGARGLGMAEARAAPADSRGARPQPDVDVRAGLAADASLGHGHPLVAEVASALPNA